MTTRETLTAAIAALLGGAGILDTDDPLIARHKLVRFLDREGCMGAAHDPENCPTAVWFRRATGLRILLTPTRVIATGGWVQGKHDRTVVDLPACVQAAIVRIDERKEPGLTKERAA